MQQTGDGLFTFIELKIASDTPLYAALEIIAYGCAWLLSRRDGPDKAGAGASALLQASAVDLVALAPAACYAPFDVGALEHQLRAEVKALGSAHGVRLTFRYEVLPQGALEGCYASSGALLDHLDARRPLHP